MDIPTQIAVTTIGAAIKFLFDETRSILKERRDRMSSLEKKPNNNPPTTPAKDEESSRNLIIQKALKKPLNTETEKDIKLLLELIDIEKQNRDRAKRQVALQGGFAFANPPTLASLELAEEKIRDHSREIKALLETFYGISIKYPFSEQTEK